MIGIAAASTPSASVQSSTKVPSFEFEADPLRQKTATELREIAVAASTSLPIRWRAVQRLAQVDFTENQFFFNELLDHKDWFMRNAGMVALSQSADVEEKLRAALKLIKDPALVVRSAAAEQLFELKDARSWPHLVEAIYAQQNFHKGQSLWVRAQIASTLSELARPGQESVLVDLVKDKDINIRNAAVRGLERLTNSSFGPLQEAQTVQKWLAWGRDQNQQFQ